MKTLEIQQPAVTAAPEEISFSLIDDSDPDEPGHGVSVHPWDRPENMHPREVAIVVGNIIGFRDDSEDHSDEFQITIVDRDQFVIGLLEVFPELRRA